MGSLADRHGSRWLMVMLFGLLSISLFWLSAARDTWSIVGCACLFGFAFGGLVPLNSHIMAHLFGLRAHGALLGTSGLAVGIGSAVGPVLTGHMYDVMGSYTVPFEICGTVVAAAALLMCLVRPLTPSWERPASS